MAMDLREYWENPEEALRALLDGARKEMHTALPVIVSEDADGHTAKLQISVKAREFDKDGKLSHVDFPLLQDVPIHFPQGGGVVHTFPIKKGDEGFVVFSSRAFDAWHQSGGVQQSVDVRTHALSDAMFVPGHRSTPRKIPNNSTESAHVRSDDGKHTHETHPQNGFKQKSVDPSDSAANPFKDAKKFFESVVHPTGGVSHNAVADGIKHLMSVAHDAGALMSSLNGAHTVQAHPSVGSLMSSVKKVILTGGGSNPLASALSSLTDGLGNQLSSALAGITAQEQSVIDSLKSLASAQLSVSIGSSISMSATLPSGRTYNLTLSK